MDKNKPQMPMFKVYGDKGKTKKPTRNSGLERSETSSYQSISSHFSKKQMKTTKPIIQMPTINYKTLSNVGNYSSDHCLTSRS